MGYIGGRWMRRARTQRRTEGTVRGPTLWALTWSACAPSIDIHRAEDAPIAVILTPADDERVAAGSVELRGFVEDASDPAERVFVIWSLGTADASAGFEPACKAFAQADGTSLCTADVRPEHTLVRMVAKDLAGFEGVATARIVVADTAPPSVELLAPAPPGPFYADAPVAWSMQVADPDHPTESLRISLGSDLDGDLGVLPLPGAGGYAEGEVQLSAGVHTLQAAVVDPDGQADVATAVIEVRPPNRAPSCRFEAPTDGAVVAVGSPATIRASVTDDWDPGADLRAELVIEPGDPAVLPVVDGWVSVAWTPVAGGPVRAVLSVRDAAGDTSSCESTFFANSQPTIELTAPAADVALPAPGSVLFAGVVSDPESAASSLRVRAVSDLQGPAPWIDADAAGRFELAWSLGAGEHALRVEVVDPHGGLASQPLTARVGP